MDSDISPQQRLVAACRKMTALMDDKQPGLICWNLEVEATYNELKAAVALEEAARRLGVN